MSEARTALARTDAWMNVNAGLGTASDKGRGWQYVPGLGAFNGAAPYLLDAYASAYLEDDVVQAVATRAPDAMFSRGVEVWVEGERSADVEDLLETSGALAAVKDALIWERLFGGGVVVLGADDGRPATEPLDLRAVRSLGWARDLDRRDVRIDEDGTVRLELGNQALRVHPSRLLWFRGRAVPRRERRLRQGWGVGAVENCWQEIQDFNGAWVAFRHLLVDGNQGIFSIPGLIDEISTRGREAVAERFRILNEFRSIARALVLDGAESFRREATNLQGYSDALERSFDRLAMACRTPVSVLVGMQPSGLNASDAGTIRMWYDSVATERTHAPTRELTRAVRVAASALGLDPAAVELRWPPLWQPTDVEAAGARRAEAEADRAEADALARAVELDYISEGEARESFRRARGLPLDLEPEPDALVEQSAREPSPDAIAPDA